MNDDIMNDDMNKEDSFFRLFFYQYCLANPTNSATPRQQSCRRLLQNAGWWEVVLANIAMLDSYKCSVFQETCLFIYIGSDFAGPQKEIFEQEVPIASF